MPTSSWFRQTRGHAPLYPPYETFIRVKKSPGDISGAFVVSRLAARGSYVRVRIRIMKLSKLSSATCIQASESAR
ncbi:hypothetical protein GGD66_003325 [Bradyrhizobium sp. CIR48]|nr:hypothetical protein [Bradyrhizobium sp. CIR48]